MTKLSGICLFFVLVISFGCRAERFTITKDSDLVGNIEIIRTKENDNFIKLAEKYRVPFNLLINANEQIDPWQPPLASNIILPKQIVLPKTRTGILINLAELRLYHFSSDGKFVDIYPIGIGKQNWLTPIAKTKIIEKKANPDWVVPESIKKSHAKKGKYLPDVIPAGADNPLGQYALRLSIPGYLIHGTNNPAGVGRRTSHGCIRMYPKDIAELFANAQVGEQVIIEHESIKIGKNESGEIYLQCHEGQEEYLKPLGLRTKEAETLINKLAANNDYKKLVTTKIGFPNSVPLLIYSPF